jgi:hypothetical protein
MEDFMAKIIYEPHPMNPARKAKLQAQGYKIIDAVFAPAGTPLHQKLDVEEKAAEAEAVIAPEVVEVVEAPAEEAPAVVEPVEEAEPAAKTGKSRKE